MINIIFLLLIFFMLTGVIQKKNLVEIERPSSTNSKIAEKSSSQDLIFILTNNEKIFHESNIINQIELEKIIKSSPKNSRIIFEIDKETKVNKINKILKILKKNKKKKIYIRSVLNDEI